jgi:hypothetical protein
VGVGVKVGIDTDAALDRAEIGATDGFPSTLSILTCMWNDLRPT